MLELRCAASPRALRTRSPAGVMRRPDCIGRLIGKKRAPPAKRNVVLITLGAGGAIAISRVAGPPAVHVVGGGNLDLLLRALIGVGVYARRDADQPIALPDLVPVGAAAGALGHGGATADQQDAKQERVAHGDSLRRRRHGAQSGARCRQFWFAATKNGSSAYSGPTTMGIRREQLGHLRNGPVLSWLTRGLSLLGSQPAVPFSPGRSEYRIFLQQGHRNERWL